MGEKKNFFLLIKVNYDFNKVGSYMGKEFYETHLLESDVKVKGDRLSGVAGDRQAVLLM